MDSVERSLERDYFIAPTKENRLRYVSAAAKIGKLSRLIERGFTRDLMELGLIQNWADFLAHAPYATNILETVNHLSELLRIANGNRIVRTLNLHKVVFCIENALQEDVPGLGWDCESVANAYNYPAQTSVAIAVADQEKVRVGVDVGPAKCCSPGRVWYELQPFQAFRIGNSANGRTPSLNNRLLGWLNRDNPNTLLLTRQLAFLIAEGRLLL